MQKTDELTGQHYIDSVKQLIGGKITIVSNWRCKKAGIQHLNSALTSEEWQILQPYIEKKKRKSNNKKKKSFNLTGKSTILMIFRKLLIFLIIGQSTVAFCL